MADKEVKNRRRGRPPLSEAQRKRHTLSFRLTNEIKEQLEARADRNGRSLSEEVEWIVSNDVYIDIPQVKYLKADLDNEIVELYNNKVDIINNCNAFQSLMSRFMVKLIDLDTESKTKDLRVYMNAFFRIVQVSRSKTSEIEWLALEQRNEIMLKIYDVLKDGKNVDSKEIKKLYEGREAQLRDYMLSVLSEIGVKDI